MNSNKLSERLQRVADYVPAQARLADIGSDHAYLPCYLAKSGKIEYAIAGEVVEGPYQSARHEISDQGLNHSVVARLGNGLEVIVTDDNINTITICGMGGALICDILADGAANYKLANRPLLILQPNVAESQLRIWLTQHQYDIISEDIVAENDKFYEIIVAVYNVNPEPLTLSEIQFGKYIKTTNPEGFKAKWTSVLERIQPVIERLGISQRNDDKLQEFKELQAAIIEQLEA